MLSAYFDNFKHPDLVLELLLLRIEQNEVSYLCRKNTKRCRPGIRWGKAAAIILVVGILSLFVAFFIQESDADTKVVMTQEGERKPLLLPDSSKVIMRENSRIEYLAAFDKREVVLDGEAYFEVEYEEGDPFTVLANYSYVKVLGTQFVVRNDSAKQGIEVGVRSGRVELGSRQTDSENFMIGDSQISELKKEQYQPIELIDGEVGVHEKGNTPARRASASLESFYGWVDDVVIGVSIDFQDAPLKQVVEVLEKKYKVEFIIKDKELTNMKFTSSFSDETLKEVLEVLTLSLDINYKKRGNKIYLSK
jgi:ferric-dicitrate binding protein FerR (iron transport regulator)